jgi:hypothetical protein
MFRASEERKVKSKKSIRGMEKLSSLLTFKKFVYTHFDQ